MRRVFRRGGSASRRCRECGVELKAGLKYCDFCGTKVADESAVAFSAKNQTHGTASRMLVGIAVGILAIGILMYVGSSIKKQNSSPAPLPVGVDGKRQAAATCEAAIRLQVRAPFRVIAFRSTLVAEEKAGYVVSGTVELQSTVGEVQRKRYFCKVHPDPRSGMVLDEARME